MTISTREDSALVEEEKEEIFYESLDRILSSSSCSCSNSDEEPDVESNFGLDPMFPVPGFPLGVFRYDIWTSQPDSVSQRRSQLMREFGLVNELKDMDKPKNDNLGVDQFEGSVLCDRLTSSTQVNDNNVSTSGICNLNSTNIDVDSSFVNRNNDGITCCDVVDVNSLCTTDGFVIGSGSEKVDEIMKVDAVSNDADSNGSVPSVLTRGVEGDASWNRSDDARLSETMCKIKNLDNGEEFVVNEIREDGTWKKLEEVGTGKQWTIEEFHFHMSVRHSPIVQEVMRRQNVEDGNKETMDDSANGGSGSGSKMKKRASWLRSIKNAASSVTGNHKERRSSDERDTSSDKGARRSSSATDDSQDVSFHGPERVRVRQYGKSCKELSALYKTQEIQAHSGSIWTIKFSLDGKYLASAGEDRIIRIWQVELEKKGESLVEKPDDAMLNMAFMVTGSPDRSTSSPLLDGQTEKKRRGRSSMSRKSLSFDHIFVPETVFALSEKPVCSFEGHLDDVLDLSWSKSQHLLSSSMDKTVRLWHLSTESCLKVFSHNDYVTCIQFNPVDDRYFISGSLDAKVRIWSIPERQVVDWSDLHEMVTAACYTPDGQGALVGSYRGSCRLYNTSENKLQEKNQINLQNKKKKSRHKKITGFQFVPGSTSEVLITSADSRIRVVNGVDLVHKFKGFRNTHSQISASITANGKYVVSASEDSYVYVWKHEADSHPSRSKTVTVARSYELFHCQDVSVAIPWPGMVDALEMENFSAGPTGSSGNFDEASSANHPPTPVDDAAVTEGSQSASGCSNSPLHGIISSATNSYFFDRFAATWPEEKLLLAARNRSSPRVSVDFSNGLSESMSAWGLVIVTAGLHGEIRTFQNFGVPVRM